MSLRVCISDFGNFHSAYQSASVVVVSCHEGLIIECACSNINGAKGASRGGRAHSTGSLIIIIITIVKRMPIPVGRHRKRKYFQNNRSESRHFPNCLSSLCHSLFVPKPTETATLSHKDVEIMH